jgi:hypothetical protein
MNLTNNQYNLPSDNITSLKRYKRFETTKRSDVSTTITLHQMITLTKVCTLLLEPYRPREM